MVGSLFVFVRGMRGGVDRLKSILLFKMENCVLSEAKICGGNRERIMTCISLVQLFKLFAELVNGVADDTAYK